MNGPSFASLAYDNKKKKTRQEKFLEDNHLTEKIFGKTKGYLSDKGFLLRGGLLW